MAGSPLVGSLKKSVFAPVRQWLYLEDYTVKLIKKIRLVDLSLVLVKVHYDIAST